MAFFKWTFHFGWFLSHFGRFPVLTIHHHILSFRPSVFVWPPTLEVFRNFINHQVLNWSFFKKSMPFFKWIIKIYNGLLQLYFKSTMTIFLKKLSTFFKENQIYNGFFKWTTKSTMAFFKRSMPFFEGIIKIYNDLFQMDLPLLVISLPLLEVRHPYDPPSCPLVQTPLSS